MSSIESDGFLSHEAETGREHIRKEFGLAFKVAEQMNALSMRVLREARLADTTQAQFVVYLLGIRVVETHQAIVLLAERAMVTPAILLVRPILEALFTIAAISANPELLERYHATQQKFDREKLWATTQWKDDYLKTIFKTNALEKKYIELSKALKENPPVAYKPIDWAKSAGLEDFYNTFYIYYASQTHSNLEALELHVDRDEHADGKVDAAFGPSSEGLVETLRNSTSFCLMAMRHLATLYDVAFDREGLAVLEAIKDLDGRINAS